MVFTHKMAFGPEPQLELLPTLDKMHCNFMGSVHCTLYSVLHSSVYVNSTQYSGVPLLHMRYFYYVHGYECVVFNF